MSTPVLRPAPPEPTPIGALKRLSETANDWSQDHRLRGLRRFAVAITVLNVLGHFWLGFETSWAHPLAALATGYTLELLLEWVDARAHGRAPRYRGGGFRGLADFLLSAHISSMAVSMLLYPGARIWPVVFATAAALGSKVTLRVRVDGRSRHVMNPSNFGIALTLILFPQVGIAPPYQFTEALSGIGNWLLPALLFCLGTLINARFTRRLPIIAAWLAGFALQAVVRSVLLDASLVAALAPMTGLAFLLFTFYMVTDPATTPGSRTGQIAFGAGVALAYGCLMSLHVVFGLFFALVVVCSLRATWLWGLEIARLGSGRRVEARSVAPAAQQVG